MYPILLHLGPINIYSFGALVSLGFIFSIAVLKHLTKKPGLQMAFIFDYIIQIFGAAIVLARIAYVALEWDIYRQNWKEIFYFWDGKLSLWGALLGAFLYFLIACFRHRQNQLVWLDQIMIAGQVLMAFTFFGLLLSPHGLTSSAFGLPTDLPWGIQIDNLNSPYAGQPVHPLAIYALLFHLITFGFLYITRFVYWAPGIRFFVGTALFASTQIIIENLRGDAAYTLFNLNFNLLCAVLALMFSVIGIIYVITINLKKRRRTVRSNQ